MPNTYSINVDIKRKFTSVVPTFRQGDSASLVFTVFDNGKNFNINNLTRAEVYHRLASGETFVSSATINNSDKTITYNYTGPEMAEIGFVETMLVMYRGTEEFSVQPFKVFIYDSMKEENLEYIDILQELIKEVQDQGLEIEKLLMDFQSYDYVASQTYVFPNLVLFNGSTYIALKEVTGQYPNDDKVNWRLVAKGGSDSRNFNVEEQNGEVYFTFPILPFNVDQDGEVFYVGENGNAGASLGSELTVWKVVE